MFIVIARTTYGSIEDRDAIMKVSAVSSRETLKEPGVVFYQNAPDLDDPLVTNVVEIYDSEKSLIDHLTSSHMAELYKATESRTVHTEAKAYEGDMKSIDLSAIMERFGVSDSDEI
jgi:quinol monooxygenase YgiN